jgi:hypothetical protein
MAFKDLLEKSARFPAQRRRRLGFRDIHGFLPGLGLDFRLESAGLVIIRFLFSARSSDSG